MQSSPTARSHDCKCFLLIHSTSAFQSTLIKKELYLFSAPNIVRIALDRADVTLIVICLIQLLRL